MSSKSNNNGRAYEFAFLKELILKMKISFEIIKNKSYFTNERAYFQNENKEIFLKSCKTAVNEILKKDKNE